MRFNHDAKNIDEITEYIKNRYLQMKGLSIHLESITETFYGAQVKWIYQNQPYSSLFLTPKYRGKGLYPKIVKEENLKILTVPDCDIEEYLVRNNLPHLVVNRFLETPEYKAISEYYGNQKAKRSKVYLMNHIDEGLAILDWIGASDLAKKAYCIHPLVQSDADLKQNFNQKIMSTFDPLALSLAMEYRSVANEYLSFRKIKSIKEIRLSPLIDVNQMLIADKIQNYKDFLKYHKKTHLRSKDLDKYFKNWFKALGVSLKTFKKTAKDLEIM